MGYRISPLMHGQNAISVNEFLSHSWKKPAVSDGTLVEKYCHFSDLMNLIIRANPVRVIASGSHDVNHEDEEYDGKIPDILDNAYVVVEYDNGSRAMLDLCMFAEGGKNEQEEHMYKITQEVKRNQASTVSVREDLTSVAMGVVAQLSIETGRSITIEEVLEEKRP